MEMTTQQGDDQAILVTIQGSIDALTAEEVIHYLRTEIKNGRTRIVADLARVNFMSSAGLRAILTILRESRQQGGDLRLAAAQPGVDKILKMSGFTSILKTYPSGEQAISDSPW